MIAVFFIYGLAFFVLGLVVLIHPRKTERFSFPEHLWLIGAFGVLHAAHEWLDMALLIYGSDLVFINILRIVTAVISFYCLVFFGTNNIAATRPRIKLLPPALILVWVVVVLFSEEKFLMADIWSRYLIALPGIVLSALVFYRHLSVLKGQRNNFIVLKLRVVIGALLVYGVLTVLVVPKAGVFPAAVINYDTFYLFIGVPVQVFKAVCAVVIAICMTLILRTFTYETKDALQDSEMRFRKLVEFSPDAAIIYGHEKFEFANAACVKMFGLKDSLEMMGKDLYEFVHPLSRESVMNILCTVIDYGVDITPKEVRLKRLDASEFYADISATRLYFQGEPFAHIIFRDITNWKQTQFRLDEYRNHLEELVDERTALLRESNLQLETEVAERTLAQEDLKRALDEKSVLIREIHHRVKNNMQIISSLLKLQAGYVQDRNADSMFTGSINRIKSMSLIQDKLFQASDLGRIDIEGYVRTLAKTLYRTYSITVNQVELRTEIENISLGIDTVIPCGLIINEFLSNALKHGFAGGRSGKIVLALTQNKDDQYELRVQDNGHGLPGGMDLTKQKSLGMELVMVLARDQLHGSVSYDSSGRGLAVTVLFRDIHYKSRI